MPKKFMTVKEVARLLGVTPLTVRNWDASGKLTAYRHPINNYRLYRVEDVENLLARVKRKSKLLKEKIQKPAVRKLRVDLEK